MEHKQRPEIMALATSLSLSRLSAPMIGAIYMSAAAVAFSVMVGLIRVATEYAHPFEVGFFRNAFALIFILPWLIRTRFSGLTTRRLKLHGLRAITGLVAMLTWFSALAVLPLAEAVSLSFTAPLFATVGAALCLGEIVRKRRWSATIIGFIGVLVILRPGLDSVPPAAILVLISALFGAISALLIKVLSRTQSPGEIVAFLAIFLTPLSFLTALPYWTWPSWPFLGLMVIAAGCGTFGHLTFARAMRVADASAVIPFDYLRLPLVAVLGYLFFSETMDIYSWLGAAIIIGSSIYIAHREVVTARQRRPEDPTPIATGAQREKL